MVQIKLQNSRVYIYTYILGKLSQEKVTFFIVMRFQQALLPRMFTVFFHKHFTQLRNE